jgi:anaerobic ribonucleoside-triphosphate reductase activating protein
MLQEMFVSVNSIKARSLVDGPGQRSVVFFQGCTIHCPGCQNKKLWPEAGGRILPVSELAATLSFLAPDGQVTISGGEPFNQPRALAYLVVTLRNLGVQHIQVYSGYTWEQLTNPINPAYLWVREILSRIDILVDGPFVVAQDDPFLGLRGSRNQRPIDVPKTLETGRVVVLDWDSPEIVIDTNGDLVLPVGLAKDFADMGGVAPSRMCGQITGS